MPDKNYQLQQVQYGKESTWGTRVPTTRELSDCTSCELTPEQEVSLHRALGRRSPLKAHITQTGGAATTEQNITYNHLAAILDSLFGTATPSGAGPYTRTYTAPDGSNPTRSFYTLLYGDSTDANSLSGALASKLVISAASGEFVTAATDWVGKEVGDDTLDSVSPDANSTYILPQHLTVSLGSLGGSLTSLACDALSAELEIDTGTTVRHGLGTVSGCDYNYGNELNIMLSLTVTADNAVIKPLYEAHLGTAPTVSTQDITVLFSESGNNSAQFDMPMFLTEPPTLYEDEDGTATVKLAFTAHFDDTGTTSFSSSCDVTIINEEATLP